MTPSHIDIPMKKRYDDKLEPVSEIELRMYSRYARASIRFGIGAVPEGVAHRREYQGPMTTEKWAYLYPLSSVISATPAATKPLVIEVDIDTTTLEIDGTVYRIADDNAFEYPKLVRV